MEQPNSTVQPTNTEVQVEPRKGIRGAVKDIFGQFATASFWKDLIRALVQEAVTTFLMALGGTLVWYGKKRSNGEIANVVGNVGQPNNGTSSVVAKAFGGGYAPTPGYSPSTSYPVPSTPSGDQRFPGFGR